MDFVKVTNLGYFAICFLSYLCGDNKICEDIEFETWGLEGIRYFISVPILFYLLLVRSLAPDNNLNGRACKEGKTYFFRHNLIIWSCSSFLLP